MIALLSLTNSFSNQSDITQLPFRPPSKWSHFSREHSSMSTESFHNSPCQCSNCRDEGRSVILKICSLLYILTAWKSQPQSGLERGMRNVTAQKSGCIQVPDGNFIFSNFKGSARRRFWVPVIISSKRVGQNLNLTHSDPLIHEGTHLSKLQMKENPGSQFIHTKIKTRKAEIST